MSREVDLLREVMEAMPDTPEGHRVRIGMRRAIEVLELQAREDAAARARAHADPKSWAKQNLQHHLIFDHGLRPSAVRYDTDLASIHTAEHEHCGTTPADHAEMRETWNRPR